MAVQPGRERALPFKWAPPAPLGKPEDHFSWPHSDFAFGLSYHYQYGRFLDPFLNVLPLRYLRTLCH
jgi:hypothetical protein